VASDHLVVAASDVPGQGARQPVSARRRAFRTGVVTLLAAAIAPFIVPLPHARAALRRAGEAIERARNSDKAAA
jgi:hypothetical protein